MNAATAEISTESTESGHPTKPSMPLLDFHADAMTIGLVSLAHGTSHFFQLLLPTLFPWFIKEFGLSFAQLGSLATIFFIVSAIGQFVSGFVVDRVGARPILFFSLSCCIAAALIATHAQGYPLLLLAAIVAGIGNSSFHPIDYSILNQRVSAARLGHAYSAHGISGNLGWGIAALFLVSIAARYSWHVALLAAAGYAACVLLVCFYFRNSLSTVVTPRALHPGKHREGAFDFLYLPVVWICWLFFFVLTFALGAIQNFSIPAVQALTGVPLPIAAATLTAYMLIGAIGQVIGGFAAANRVNYNPDRSVAAALAFSALMFGTAASGLFSGWSAPALIAIVALAGLGQGMAAPSRDLLIKRVTPKQSTGRVYGTVYSGLDLGLAVSPLLFGVLMDHGMPRAMFAAAAVTLLLASTMALWVGRYVPPQQ